MSEQRKPMGRPPKMPADHYKRLGLMVDPSVDQTLRRIADERFWGNLSRATAWSIGLAASVLDGPLNGLQVPNDPTGALAIMGGER